MNVLVDTNVLLRSVQKTHPTCRIARQALVSLYRSEQSLYLSTQNVAEFWNVCTRPIQVNGLGLSVTQTDHYVDELEKFFTILPDSNQVFRVWRRLVVEHAVIGVRVHDSRLVALMKTYDIPQIITFNVSDFTRFSGIEAVHPDKMASTVG